VLISGSSKDGRYNRRNFQIYEELNDLYSSPNIVRVIKLRTMRWTEYVARMGERRCLLYSALVDKPEEKRQLRRPSRRWEDSTKMDL
jgi:hypothetical protein